MKSNILLSVFFYVLVMGIPSAALACPPAPGEKTLSFTQLMINFGKYLRKADGLALKGLRFPAEISSAEIEAALSDIDVALQCAETSFGPNPLLPNRILRLSSEEIQSYTARLQTFMRTFQFLLIYYRDALSGVIANDKSQSYKEVHEISLKVREWAAEAHAYL